MGPGGFAQSNGLPVFPGATGFGTATRAAYGGTSAPEILRVTNLNDSGSGSLRAALEASSPRIVIFEISGTIDLSSQVVISNPYLTVGGQTAPSPGITLRDHGLEINTHDVLLQHFRIRPGDSTCNSSLLVWNYGGNPYNIVLDHMSVSWGQDENFAFANANRALDMTIWRSITAEGLFRVPGSDSCTGGGLSNGHGMLIYASARNVFVGQTLFANNTERNPYMESDSRTVLVNNVIYQWHGPQGFFFSNADSSGNPNGPPWFASAVGNRFVIGPYSTDSGDPNAYMFYYSAAYGSPAGNRIYRRDNTIANGVDVVVEEGNRLSYDPNVGSPPSQAQIPGGLIVLPSTLVESVVLANAGARPVDRDDVDARIVQEVASRTGAHIWSQNDVGGWPRLAVNVRLLSVPSNPHTRTNSGYTVLEQWLHGFAAAVEGATNPGAPPPPTGLRLVP
jgi:hypothetical protein